jgi:hypothetical protein
MSFQKIFNCDRKGCKNTTTGLSLYNETSVDTFSYEDESWLGVRVSQDRHHDFCSWECLGMFVDAKIKEVRGGKTD